MKAYRLADKYGPYPPGIAVEVGSERGEGSTAYLAQYFEKVNNVGFFSVDFEDEAHLRAVEIIGARAYHMMGETFLSSHAPGFGKICFAYLDNYDWWFGVGGTLEQCLSDQIALYAEHGLVLNNLESVLSHLRQAKAIAANAHEKCVVIFDDTKPTPDGNYWGKGGAGVPYLLTEGFEIAEQTPVREDHGHVVLVRNG